MEREDKRPQVWTVRKLMSRGCNCNPVVMAYFASKARVQGFTKQYSRNGKTVKEVEIEFETPAEFEDLYAEESGMFAEEGVNTKMPIDMICKTYEECVQKVYEHNLKMQEEVIGRVPEKWRKETFAETRAAINLGKRYENCFDKEYNVESKELYEIF